MSYPADRRMDPDGGSGDNNNPFGRDDEEESIDASLYIENEDVVIARILEEQLRESQKKSMGKREGSTFTGSSSASESEIVFGRDDMSAQNASGSQSVTSSNSDSRRKYTINELIACLDHETESLPPALERRVRDFKFARTKRLEKYGEQRPWGIFGLYAHLSDIRADLEWAEDAAWRRQHNEPYLSWTDFENTREKGFKNRPFFTYGVIFLSTVMLIVSIGVNGWKLEPVSVNPLLGPSSSTLIKVGARQTSLIVNDNEWWRLFSPMILHAGIIHYIINMAAMWFLGRAIELSHGFVNTFILFFIPAVGGTILSAIFLPQYISVGASGGIFGLIGGCFADILLNWNLLFLKTTTDQNTRFRHAMVLFWLFLDIVVNCLLGLTPFIDNFSHLGGLIYGLFCGLSTIEKLAIDFFGLTHGKCSQVRNTLVKFIGLIVSVVMIMVTIVVLIQSDGETSPCSKCRYVSCVPFPPGASDKWWYCDDCDNVAADLFRLTDGSGLYTAVELTCPNGEIENIDIQKDGYTEKEKLRRDLPDFCRDYCEETIASN